MQVSLRAITIHYNPLQSITIQVDFVPKCLKIITIHYDPLQSITIHYKLVHVFVTILVQSLQSITIHYDPLQMTKKDLNPPLNPYLLAPPILETEP